LWIGVDVRIIERNLNLWWGILSKCHRPIEQNNPKS
jgi:hypothetical protein